MGTDKKPRVPLAVYASTGAALYTRDASRDADSLHTNWAQIAPEVGYESEQAFNRAFTCRRFVSVPQTEETGDNDYFPTPSSRNFFYH